MAVLVAIEGIDGSGKSTQVDLLCRQFDQQKLPYYFIHFPRLGTQPFGHLIAQFLRGEFGDLNQVHPQLVALLYAQDRHDETKSWQTHLDNGVNIIVDRYVYSNIAYQTAKLQNETEQQKLSDWILDLEYNYFKIPKPHLSLFLHTPFEFSLQAIEKRHAEQGRDYLSGKDDIHEKNSNFQHAVYNAYLNQVNSREDFDVVNCFDSHGKMLDVESIHRNIWTQVSKLSL